MTRQVHDYNAGITPSGLFWTLRVPDEALTRGEDESGAVAARLVVENAPVVDSFQIFSGIEVPATVSFDMTWTPSGAIRHLRPRSFDPSDQGAFSAEFALADSNGTFSGSSVTMPGREPFSFEGEATSEGLWGEMGTERNGVFLRRRLLR